MGAIASQITSLASVYSAVELGIYQRKHDEFPAQRPVTRKMYPFDDVIMSWSWCLWFNPDEYWVSLHLADGLLTVRAHEVSKQRDSGLDFSNSSEF